MSIVTFDTLVEVTGVKTPAAVAVSLTKQGVRYFNGRGGKPWTTEAALNAALGVTPGTNTPAHKPRIDID